MCAALDEGIALACLLAAHLCVRRELFLFPPTFARMRSWVVCSLRSVARGTRGTCTTRTHNMRQHRAVDSSAGRSPPHAVMHACAQRVVVLACHCAPTPDDQRDPQCCRLEPGARRFALAGFCQLPAVRSLPYLPPACFLQKGDRLPPSPMLGPAATCLHAHIRRGPPLRVVCLLPAPSMRGLGGGGGGGGVLGGGGGGAGRVSIGVRRHFFLQVGYAPDSVNAGARHAGGAVCRADTAAAIRARLTKGTHFPSARNRVTDFAQATAPEPPPCLVLQLSAIGLRFQFFRRGKQTERKKRMKRCPPPPCLSKPP